MKNGMSGSKGGTQGVAPRVSGIVWDQVLVSGAAVAS